MKKYRTMPFLYLISLMILQLACQESSINKLDDSYLSGTTSSEYFNGNISSLYTTNLYVGETLPENVDSIKLYRIINEKLKEISTMDLDQKRNLYSRQGRLLFKPGYHNEIYKYNDSGLLSEVSTRGSTSNRLYYREYFQYNMDTTECNAKSYIMKKVKPQNYEGYDKYESFEIADSIYWAGPDTTNYLYTETNYKSTDEGLVIHKVTYVETDTTLDEILLSRINKEKTLKIEFRYSSDNRPSPFLAKFYYKNNRLIKREHYALTNLVAFHEFSDFIKKTPDVFKFLEANQAGITSSYHYDLNGGTTKSNDSFGDRTGEHNYIFDDQGNWTARIYINPLTKKYGNTSLRYIEYY